MSQDSHDRDLAAAFDGQAAQFEVAPVQSDPAMLARLVAFANFAPGTTVLDAGCGPGLVSEAFAAAGYAVVGVDLSPEMIQRARNRCARFGERASFQQRSVMDLPSDAQFGGAVSRYVLHHVVDPAELVQAQVARLTPGGVLVACDHTTDPAPAQAETHQAIEKARDRTHTRNLTTGELLDLFTLAGLGDLESREERFTLDFDEWFDRGTPDAPKDEVRAQVLAARVRGFTASEQPGGAVTISCWRSYVRGVKP
ncbi:MAG TPA: class I SAM-dependent methyltransferase [Polyangia bacterium]|nr:class I SAM-dependent methyltransferase [Polyangia bacterium]